MLLRLFPLDTSSGNPSGRTNLLPGGAGVQVAGKQVYPMVSGPKIEEVVRDIFDVTASGSTPTPAASGKLLVLDATTGTVGAATWRQNATAGRAIPRGSFGIVFMPGQASEATASGGTSTGTKAQVVIEGPCAALLTTGPTTTTAISAGMYLAADAAGNLTYAGASPAAGTVLATAMGPLATGISTPTLTFVNVGGF